MAGIGFELKKAFGKGTLSSAIKGSTYAVFVTSGPMILNLIMIMTMVQVLKHQKVSGELLSFFESSIMYAYIFSLLIVSGFIMVIARYASDQLYLKNTTDLLASLIGVIALCSVTGGMVGAVFYAASPLPVLYKLLSYQIFMELCIMNVLMVFVSAVKDYTKVAGAFALGLVITVTACRLLLLFDIPALNAVLGGVVLGYFFSILYLVSVVKGYFLHISDNTFGFLTTLNRNPLLFFINLLYSLGLFGHNLLFWFMSDLSVSVAGTYRSAPNYDSATFFAIFTIIPSIVMFTVKVETSFYRKIRIFDWSICHGGTLDEIRSARDQMTETLTTELTFLFELQLVITLLAIILGNHLVLPLFGSNRQTVELFSYLSLGFFIAYMTYIVITFLLYFDDQKSAFITALCFSATSLLLTWVTLQLDPIFYGMGLCLSALLSFSLGTWLLRKTLDQVIYTLYTHYSLQQTEGSEEKEGVST